MTVEPFKRATISDGDDTSTSVHMLPQQKVMMIYADANFDGSAITFEVNVGDIGTPVWKPLVDDDANAVSITLAADSPTVIDTNAGKVAQLRSFRVVSDAAQSGADCEFRFFMK